MTRYDYACMTCCYGMLGAMGWAIMTLDVLPGFIAGGISIIVAAVSYANGEIDGELE